MGNIQVKLRRGTTAQHSTFTGAEGELTFDTTRKTLIVHDGITAGGKSPVNDLYVSVKDYGAVGDGTTDDATAIQSAIDSFASGGTVIIPPGNYGLGTSIYVKSNITVSCEPGAYFTPLASITNLIKMEGVAGSENALTVAAGAGDTQITVTSSLSVGDLVQIISVRNALNRVDAGEYWCGDGTSGAPEAYFSEWKYIAEDLGSLTYRLSSPLLFDGYETTAAGETETSRTTSAVCVITPVKNAHWIGGYFNVKTSTTYNLRTDYAVDCTYQDCQVDMGSRTSVAVYFVSSHNCEARNVTAINDPTLVWDYNTLHGKLNRFRTVGSSYCGFRGVRSDFSAQAVDFTYGTGGQYVNIAPYCIDSEFRNCFEGLTSHPGCYRELWKGNRIYQADDAGSSTVDGINIRGNSPTVIDNIIEGSFIGTTSSDDTVGVKLLYGATINATITNNIIRNFGAAFATGESDTEDWDFAEVRANISNNTIYDCYYGLELSFLSTGAYKGTIRNIVYSGNTHFRIGRYMVRLENYASGVAITNNTLVGDFRNTTNYVAMVFADNNCPFIIVKNNSWLRTLDGNTGQNRYGVYLPGVTDTTTFPDATYGNTSLASNNYIAYALEDGVVDYGTSALYVEPKERPYYTIASGEINIQLQHGPVTYIEVNTEASAATDDLDRIVVGLSERTIPRGHMLVLRPYQSSRDITLRDIDTSGAASDGIQTPSNASITTASYNNVIILVWAGTHWAVAAKEITT